MNNNLRNQNIQIENINSDMDKIGLSLNKTTNRFERYLEKTSYCKLYVIIFLHASIILYLLF